MNTATRLLLAAALALPLTTGLVACKKETAPVVKAPEVVAMPASGDHAAWRQYVTSVAKQHMDGVFNAPYVYFLPAETEDDYQGKYDRTLEQVDLAVQRIVQPNNMLVFASPSPGKAADLAVEGFKNAKPSSMKDVKVLLIGKPEDQQRVRDAVTPSGATFVFHEAK